MCDVHVCIGVYECAYMYATVPEIELENLLQHSFTVFFCGRVPQSNSEFTIMASVTLVSLPQDLLSLPSQTGVTSQPLCPPSIYLDSGGLDPRPLFA